MTNKEFKALVDADIRRLIKQAEDQIIAENLQKLINRSKQYMEERDWDREDMLDETDSQDDEWTSQDDFNEDLKDRYDQMRGR